MTDVFRRRNDLLRRIADELREAAALLPADRRERCLAVADEATAELLRVAHYVPKGRRRGFSRGGRLPEDGPRRLLRLVADRLTPAGAAEALGQTETAVLRCLSGQRPVPDLLAPAVARLAERLGLAGPHPETAEAL